RRAPESRAILAAAVDDGDDHILERQTFSDGEVAHAAAMRHEHTVAGAGAQTIDGDRAAALSVYNEKLGTVETGRVARTPHRRDHFAADHVAIRRRTSCCVWRRRGTDRAACPDRAS